MYRFEFSLCAVRRSLDLFLWLFFQKVLGFSGGLILGVVYALATNFSARGFLVFVSLFLCLQRIGHFSGWLGHFSGESDIFRVLSTIGQLTNSVRLNSIGHEKSMSE